MLNSRKKIMASLLATVSIALLSACGGNSAVTTLAPKDFASKIEDTAITVVDVRTPSEFASGHIARAINVDFEAADFQANISKLDQSKTYAVYCHSGRRSGLATALMAKLGFKHIYNLDGGISNWVASGNQIVNN
jgi:rhodanese-related sulfurtransferase